MDHSSLAQVGIMSRMSTGNAAWDMILCCVMPLLMSFLTREFQNYKQWFLDTFSRWYSCGGNYSRTIPYVVPDMLGHINQINSKNKVRIVASP